tara:strand:+ start:91 stop:1068 length:978 start_codon:yes stop_codon:yes gene_type:complete
MDSYQKMKKYLDSNILDKFSYTILIFDYECEQIVNQIKKKIDNINKKSMDSFKKKTINDRLYNLRTSIENKYKKEDIINDVIFVNESIDYFPLNKKDIQFCKEWNISKFLFIQNGIDIENAKSSTHESVVSFVEELFTIEKIKTVFKFDKSSFCVNHIDQTKTKIIESHSINEELVNTLIGKHKPVIIYGLNPLVKKLSSVESLTQKCIIENKNLQKSDIMDLINKFEIKENQYKFKTIVLDNINNPSYDEKFLFGTKEVSYGLDNYMVKHLFINPKLYSNFTSSEDSKQLISNIQVTIVQPLEAGDIGTTLNKNYGGTVALKYY